MSDIYISIQNGLKQGDGLLPLLFNNFTLEYATSKVQEHQEG
jgi:hypothetical protein